MGGRGPIGRWRFGRVMRGVVLRWRLRRGCSGGIVWGGVVGRRAFWRGLCDDVSHTDGVPFSWEAEIHLGAHRPDLGWVAGGALINQNL